VRLGFRQVKGLQQSAAQRLVAARKMAGLFRSMGHFARMADLPQAILKRLAEADTFGSMGLSRRQALWRVLNCPDRPPPLFEDVCANEEPPVFLPAMPMMQEVTTDYRTAGLSLKTHPLALIREELKSRKIIPAARVAEMPHGRWVSVAGLVLIRQRPATASGIMFATLEDETGVVNLIIRPNIYDRFRPAARHATMLQAQGRLQRAGQVIHLMAERLADLSLMLSDGPFKSRDFR
jgi:error-prone DNA polymerase